MSQIRCFVSYVVMFVTLYCRGLCVSQIWLGFLRVDSFVRLSCLLFVVSCCSFVTFFRLFVCQVSMFVLHSFSHVYGVLSE